VVGEVCRREDIVKLIALGPTTKQYEAEKKRFNGPIHLSDSSRTQDARCTESPHPIRSITQDVTGIQQPGYSERTEGSDA
jgi:hypothetical protein